MSRGTSNFTGDGSDSATQIGTYQRGQEIGRGGMAIVYRGRDARLNREVAIKLPREDYAADSPACVRFVAEAQITGQLQHPCIPSVHELGKLDDGRPFLAMKLVKGQTLQQLLDRATNTPQERGQFIAVFEQVCHALGYAHSHGVIHRDLKPSNIMVGAFGEVQVMDWGLAKVLASDSSPSIDPEEEFPATIAVEQLTGIETPGEAGSATRTGSVFGTPAYMAPEQAAGEIRKLDARTDVFGLGAILYQILTGSAPYHGANAHEIRLKAVRGELQEAFAQLENCGAEPELVELCRQCLAFQQDDRPADGGIVAREVARIRNAAEERARQAELERAEALVREGEQRKRRRVWLGLAVTLLVGLIASTALGLWANYAREQAEIARGQATAAQRAEAKRAAAEARAKEEAQRLFKRAVENTDRLTALAEENMRLGTGQASILERVITANIENLDALAADAKGVEAESVRVRLGANLASVASLRLDLGRTGDGAAAAQRAVTELESVLSKKPTDAHVARWLAQALEKLATSEAYQGNTDNALRVYERALAVRRQLAEREPENLEYQGLLARSYHLVANVHNVQADWEQARQHYEQSATIREKLVAERPESVDWLTGLALSKIRVANMRTELGERIDEIPLYRSAIETHQELLAKHPEDSQLKRWLADLHFEYGHELQNAGKPEEAAVQFVAGREIAIPQSLADPGHAEWKRIRWAADISLFDIVDPNLKMSPEQELDAIGQIVEACQQQVASDPADRQWKSRLGLAKRIRALIYLRVSPDAEGLKSAEADVREALEIAQSLSAHDPKNFNWAQSLSTAQLTLSQIHIAQGNTELAQKELRAEYEVLLKYWLGRTTTNPDNLEWRARQAQALGRLAGLFMANPENRQQAIETYTSAIELLRPLVEEQPGKVHWREQLAAHYWYVAGQLAAQDKFEEAASQSRIALDHYLDLRKLDPDGPTRLHDLSQAYDSYEFHARMAGLSEEAKAILRPWRAVRAAVASSVVKQMIEPPQDSKRRQVTGSLPEYHREHLARQSSILNMATYLYWADRIPERLVVVAESAINYAASATDASRSLVQNQLNAALDLPEVRSLLEIALLSYQSARASEPIAEETELMELLQQTIDGLSASSAAVEQRRNDLRDLAKALEPARDILTRFQQPSVSLDSTTNLAKAINEVFATITNSDDETANPNVLVPLFSHSAHTAGVRSIAASPDGRWIVTAANDKSVKLRDAQLQNAAELDRGEAEAAVNCLTITADNRLLAGGTDDGRILIWDLESRTLKSETKLFDSLITSISFSTDGKLLAVTAPVLNQPGVVRIWNVEEGRELEALEDQGAAVFCVSFVAGSPNSLIAVGLVDNEPTAQVRMVDVETRMVTRETKIGLPNYALSSTIVEQPSLADPSAAAHAVAVSPDGALMAVSDVDSNVTVWNTQSGQQAFPVKLPNSPRVVWLRFDAAGERLVVGDQTGRVSVWDARSGEQLSSVMAGYGAARGALVGNSSVLATARGDILPFPWPEETKLWQVEEE